MPISRTTPTTTARAGVSAPESLLLDDVVVPQHAEMRPGFGDFLAEFSAALLDVDADGIECLLTRWLDRLSNELGVDRCTVGEFNAVAGAGFHVQWLVGKHPAPLLNPDDSWIRNRLNAGKSVAIASLDEIPAEAVSTRQELEEMGVRSGIWVPLVVEETVLGAIGLTVISHELIWPQTTIERCELVGRLIGSALLKRRKTAEIEELLQFEVLATNIASRFMNIDGGTNALTDEVLSELGDFLKVDRISYIEFNVEEDSLIPTRQWFSEGIEPDNSVQNVNVSAQFPWMMSILIAGEPVAVDKLDQFPDEASNERRYCEQIGIKSFTMVPAKLDGEVVAALALDSIFGHRNWDKPILMRLKLIAGMIAAAQHRIRQRRELVELRRFESAISIISTKFVNLLPEAVDGEIETGLGIVARTLGADVITMLQPNAETDYEVSHEWSSSAFDEYIFKGSPAVNHKWWANRVLQRENVVISKFSDWPEEAAIERNNCERLGLQSVVGIPFDLMGEWAGYLCISSLSETTWSKNYFPQLRLLGGVFGEALNRRDSEIDLRKSYDEIESLKDRLREENLILRQEAKLTYKHGDIIGDSGSLQAVLKMAEQVAPTESTVLILGETGTGKELLARAIHDISPQADKLMVTVNCAALPSSLVEAELFGREKGAYTGALSRELGRFEVANGSTILLDEIGELSLELQAKLLRVLEEGEFERLGSSKTIKVKVRVLASTNRDLDKAVANKEFREDLFYRLNVFPIEVPPLRDRAEDIPQLVWAFVQDFSESMGKTIESIPVHAMDSLMAHTWPGNIREVRNIIERAMIVTQGPVLEVELPGNTVTSGRGAPLSRKLADVEREHIQVVVESAGWRIRGPAGAAEILGLKPTTLEARMKKLGFQRTSKQ